MLIFLLKVKIIKYLPTFTEERVWYKDRQNGGNKVMMGEHLCIICIKHTKNTIIGDFEICKYQESLQNQYKAGRETMLYFHSSF